MEGLCRCCLAENNSSNLETLEDELLSNLMFECFNIRLQSLPKAEDNQRICCSCSPRLQDAVAFRKQVQSCEDRLSKYYEKYCKGDKEVEIKIEPKIKDGLKYEGTVDFFHTTVDINEVGVKQEDDLTFGNNNENDSRPGVKLEYNLIFENDNIDDSQQVCFQYVYEPPQLVSKEEEGDITKPASQRLKSQSSKDLKAKPPNLKNESSVQKLKCKFCKSFYATQKQLENHMRAHQRKYNCLICGEKNLNDSKHLVKHIEKFHITQDNTYPCNICPVTFDRPVELKNHLLKHFKETPKFICDVCNKGFGKKTRLIDHLFSHNTGQFACDICGRRFNNKQSLKPHRRTHEGVKTHMCDTCGKKFSTSSVLTRHIRIKHLKIKNYPCEYCPKKFSSKRNLLAHHNVHTGEKAFPCKICEEKFVKDSHLTKHMQVHPGAKPYPCEICKKCFRDSRDLKKHMYSHAGKKVHTCKICNKQIKNLNKHMQVHSGVKPYSCELCSWKFSGHSNLKQHMRTHTGEKPYACETCNSRFTQNSALKRHRCIHDVKGEKSD